MKIIKNIWNFFRSAKKEETEVNTKEGPEGSSGIRQEGTSVNTHETSNDIPHSLRDKLCVPVAAVMFLPEGEIEDAAIGTYHVVGDNYIIFTDRKGELYPDDARYTNCLVVEYNSKRKENNKNYFCVVLNKQTPNEITERKRAILFFYTESDENVYDLKTDLYLSDNVKVIAFDQSAGNLVAIMEPESTIEIEYEYIDSSKGGYSPRKINFVVQYKPEHGIYVVPVKVYASYHEFLDNFFNKDLSSVQVL